MPWKLKSRRNAVTQTATEIIDVSWNFFRRRENGWFFLKKISINGNHKVKISIKVDFD